jgi:hypothetical protein
MFLDGMPAATPGELDRIESEIDGWLSTSLAEHQAMGDDAVLVAVDRGEPGERRWYVRLRGEQKDFTTVWLTLGQRALHVETYVMPAPEENDAEFYAHLLRRNRAARGLWFCIGDEDALYLVGQVPHALVDEANLDRVLGSAYRYVEDWFRPALRIGYASRFGG